MKFNSHQTKPSNSKLEHIFLYFINFFNKLIFWNFLIFNNNFYNTSHFENLYGKDLMYQNKPLTLEEKKRYT